MSSQGQLGDGVDHPSSSSPNPVEVVNLEPGVRAIDAGQDFSCALLTSGAVRCWGNGTHGQLGNATNQGQPTPLDVIGLHAGVKAIAVGDSHACAVLAGGNVRCWGVSELYRLGRPDDATNNVPGDVLDLAPSIASVYAGAAHSCALTSTGSLYCWGDNRRAELGNGTTSLYEPPANPVGLSSDVVSVATGMTHSCAVLASGEVRCWGDNDYGQSGTASGNTCGAGDQAAPCVPTPAPITALDGS